ncbi:MAG: flagellar filament capping protein FliD [Planctomycetota bacterium]|jgi:flagellar hook-associated protein 2
MGSITTGIGLISGIDIATLIDNLIALESRGKVALQVRLANLQSQQAALLDINARLLNLKTTSRSFRLDSIFDSALALSSDSDVLTATATGSAQPGTYSFLVKQLVSNSQKLSRGFADTDTTPVGLTSLTFEIGNGRVSTNTELSELNGGAGVRRGKIIITDSASNSATIDLGKATTVNEVLAAINDDTTVSVTATVDGDHLVVTDDAGGAGTLTIANATSDFTATDLGIDKTAVGGVITGDDIRSLGASTSLASLNDGTGVLIVDNNPDFKITTRNGRVFDIDLGRVDNPITASTLIEDLNDGDGVTLNSDSEADIKFVARDGTEYEVDLTGITTVDDLQSRVNAQTGGVINITIHADGDKLVVNDTVNPSGLLKVLGSGVNGTTTAEDLGILETTGVDAPSFDGQALENADHTPATQTIQDVIDRINNAKDDLGVDNGGHIVASIAPDGVSLQIEDTVGGGQPSDFKIESTTANAYAARDLGIESAGVGASILDGNRLVAGLNSVLVRSLNGGAGLSGDDTLTITDRLGGSDTFTLDEDGSLSEIISQINASTNIEILASLNEAGNGLLITDTSGGGGNLIVTGNAADDLKIDTGGGGVAADSYRGDNLQIRYVAEGTLLAALNYGRGIGTGQFRITDGEGDQVTVDIGSDSNTVFDVIDEINAVASANDVDVTARVNDNGDGILIENTLGTGLIKVESISGTTAQDLNILGQADTEGGDIDGSFETVVAFNASDTVDEVLSTINSAGIPVSASVLNTGGGATPYHITIASQITGLLGDLVIDDGGFGLGLTTLSEAKDAEVFFGSDDPADGILIRRTSNTLDNVVEGVTIDLVSASDDPVTVTVSRDTEAIVGKASDFVAAFNDAIGRINQYDFYDTENEDRGVLLGNPTTARVRNALYRVVQGRATGVETQFQYLSQVGITVGAEGVLKLDQEKFRDAYESDPEAVENLFTAFQGTTVTTEEIAPGVTVTVNEQTYTELGFGDLFDQLLEGLTNSIDGTVTLADQGLQDQIDLTQDRIDDFDERLAARREQLRREFTAMETALAQLQVQNSALAALAGNLALAQNLFSFNL